MKNLTERFKAFLVISPYAPLYLFLFAVIDGAGVPTPGGLDFFLVALAAYHPEKAFQFAVIALAGSLIGCMFLFYVARKAGEVKLTKYRSRPRFARLEAWFQHYGLLTVFIPAILPIPLPLKFFVICAGVFEVSPRSYLLTLVAARIPRYFMLAYLGKRLGLDSWRWILSHWTHLLIVALLLFGLLYLLIWIVDRRKRLTARA